jgi:hypothetical protein
LQDQPVHPANRAILSEDEWGSMSDPETHNFDDELLSAYLDDELAAEQRARVDERLAADPAARKLLDELRAVSQATRQLPPEKLQGDMRETILRRAERAMLLSTAGEPAAAGGDSGHRRDDALRFSIGRSPRGWLWAALAVAAALMLMVYQSEPDPNDNLPGAVAARSDESRESAGRPADRSELRALTEESTIVEDLEPPPAAARPAGGVDKGLAEPLFEGGAVAGDQLARGESSSSPAATDATDATDAETRAQAPDAVGGWEPGVGQAWGLGGAVAESERQDTNWLLVHLQCDPRAIERKVFDDTLVKNRIAIEQPEIVADESSARESRSSDAASAAVRFQTGDEHAREPGSGQQPPVDVVLVEAEPAQIRKCLEDLDADDQNFLAIAVEEQPAAADGAVAEEQNGIDWKQYNRGRLAQQGKLERGAEDQFYYQSDRGPLFFGYQFRSEDNVPQLETLAKQGAGDRQSGRARRLQLDAVGQQLVASELADRRDKAGESSQSTAGTKLELARRGSAMLPKAKANLLQVLFVLQAGGESTFPAATDRSQGLQKDD